MSSGGKLEIAEPKIEIWARMRPVVLRGILLTHPPFPRGVWRRNRKARRCIEPVLLAEQDHSNKSLEHRRRSGGTIHLDWTGIFQCLVTVCFHATQKPGVCPVGEYSVLVVVETHVAVQLSEGINRLLFDDGTVTVGFRKCTRKILEISYPRRCKFHLNRKNDQRNWMGRVNGHAQEALAAYRPSRPIGSRDRPQEQHY